MTATSRPVLVPPLADAASVRIEPAANPGEADGRKLVVAPAVAVAPQSALVGAAKDTVLTDGVAMVGASRSKPALRVNNATQSTLTLHWNRVANAKSYMIIKSDGGTWRTVRTGLAANATSFRVSSLHANSTYRFRVAAVKISGKVWSNVAIGTTRPKYVTKPPAAPSFTAVSVSSDRVDLSWNAASGATGYGVYQWNGYGWTCIATLGSSAYRYSVGGLTAGKTYYFHLAAINGAGRTWANSWQSVTMQAAADLKPAAPIFSATAVSSSQINLGWNPSSLATGYTVYQYINGDWEPIAYLGASATNYSATGLSAATTYYFQVAATNSYGSTWADDYQSATTKSSFTFNTAEPASAVSYRNVSGKLFGSGGPSFFDVRQGVVGDCWLLAGFAAVAARSPNTIRNMFTYVGAGFEDGWQTDYYRVRFFGNDGSWHQVLVNTLLPNGGQYYGRVANGVLWVALAEKAYAQACGEGFVSASGSGNSYQALDKGWPSWAIKAVTGSQAYEYNTYSSNVVSAWNAGRYVVLCTGAQTQTQNIVPTHAYAMVDYKAGTSQPFYVYNPWGADANGDALLQYEGHKVYGYFSADAGFINANFTHYSRSAGAVTAFLDRVVVISAIQWTANESAVFVVAASPVASPSTSVPTVESQIEDHVSSENDADPAVVDALFASFADPLAIAELLSTRLNS